MINMLIISSYVPYDTVGHAGGKTHNYYLKKFHNAKDFKVKLITFGSESEKNSIDLDDYKIEYEIDFPGRFFKDSRAYQIFNLKREYNIFDKSSGMLPWFKKEFVLEKLIGLKEEGYYPDVIILDWTEMVLMVKEIKKIYPKSKYIASESDVSFLSFRRKYLLEKNIIKRIIKWIKYKNLLNYELQALRNCNLIVTQNFKDKNLLVHNEIDERKIEYISPYYIDMFNNKPEFNSNNIIFFGAMNRPENFECCIWFIENVFNRLSEIDSSFKFYIIGGRPVPELLRYSSDNIIITGFIDDVKEYFESAMCMVVPLLLGAGIKVKVLEGMSAGIPILTNDIGIEGIPAIHEESFLYCRKPEDYIRYIMDIKQGKINVHRITNSARKMIKKEFNLEESFNRYKMYIKNLKENNH